MAYNRAGTPSRGGQPDEEYYDDDDLLDEYTHERLPTEPQQLNLELPESNLDLTMTFNSILTAPDPPESAQEYVFPSVLPFSPSFVICAVMAN